VAGNREGRGGWGVMLRLVLAVLGLALTAPACAGAQTAPLANAAPADRTLSDALFVSQGPRITPYPAIQTHGALAASATGQVFATPDALLGQGLAGQPVPTGRVAATGEGLIAWRTSEVTSLSGDGAVDTVRMTTVSVSRTPLIGPAATLYDPNAVAVSYSRGWPGALVVRAGGMGVNVSPHAGFGMDSGGGRSAEAGAMVKFSSIDAALQDKLEAMGVKDGATSYGNQGRWYLFAAVRGQAVGLNMQESEGALRRAGWSTDVSSALVGDGQVGVGWRKGGIEASFGYVHRGVHLQNAPIGASDSYADDMAALAFTYHPHW
jgi:hypothetical protein